ncbi:hypothetical protein AAMO2058_000506300 [Amorphochlora amoebiformis]
MMEASPAKPRVLCLHGMGINSEFMSTLQIGMCSFRDLCDWNYMNGPIISDPAPGIENFLRYIKDKKYYTWLSKSSDGKEYKGFEEAQKAVEVGLEKIGDVDFLLGFSQGSILASIVGEELYKKGQLKGVILVCGVDSKQKIDTFTIPSFHIVGKMDKLRKRSLRLYNAYTGAKQIVEHSGGHKFPAYNEKDIRNRLHSFCQRYSRPLESKITTTVGARKTSEKNSKPT